MPLAGATVRASDNQYVLDPPRCATWDNTGIACANGSAQILTFDTESYDWTTALHSTASFQTRITYPVDGLYQVNVFVRMPSATYTQFDVNPRVNATSAITGTSIRTFAIAPVLQCAVTFEYPFVASDYMQIYVTQTSGASRTTQTGGIFATGVQVRWVAPIS